MQGELYWAAGFWDGEGHASVYSRRSGTEYNLMISQTYRPNLERFLQAIGVGKIYGPYNRSHRVHAPYFVWSAGKWENCKRVIDILYPLISPPKQAQFEKVMEFKENHERK